MTATEAFPARARYARALQELRAAQKSNRGAPAYSRFVNRPFGRRLAAGAHVLGLTPNAVTVISAAFTFTAIAALATRPPTPATAAGITAFLLVGYGLDSADGQLARLRGGGSPAGEWLDHVVDSVKNTTLHLAVAVCLYRFLAPDRPALTLVALGYAAVSATMFLEMVLTEKLRALAGVVPPPDDARPSTLRALAVIPSDYGFLCLVFVTLWVPPVFVTLYALMALGCTGYLVLGMVKRYRGLRRLAPVRAAAPAPVSGVE